MNKLLKNILLLILSYIIFGSALYGVKTLERKYRNPYYVENKKHSGGIIINGVPIPLVTTKGKSPSYTQEQVNAIKSELGDDINIRNVLQNKKYLKYNGLRSFLQIIGYSFLLVTFVVLGNIFKKGR